VGKRCRPPLRVAIALAVAVVLAVAVALAVVFVFAVCFAVAFAVDLFLRCHPERSEGPQPGANIHLSRKVASAKNSHALPLPSQSTARASRNDYPNSNRSAKLIIREVNVSKFRATIA
jgi:hypothetical protein